jgi:hypothetical protein
MTSNTTAKPVAFVLKGYPRLSETFIAQEIEALERRGLEIRIISLRHPTEQAVHPVHRRIRAPVSYLPEYLYQEPLRVWRAWKLVRRWPGYRAARRLWLGDLGRDRSPNRVRRFGQALVLAAELDGDISHLHAHFLHRLCCPLHGPLERQFVDLFGPCQGYLDHTRVGEAGETGGSGLAGYLQSSGP